MTSLKLLITPSSFSPTPPSSFKPPQVPSSPAIHITGVRSKWSRRTIRVVTRAGPSINNIIFAVSIPTTLLLATIFTASKIADKLDEDYFDELAINKALMGGEEDDEDEDEDDDEGGDYEEEDEDNESGVDFPSSQEQEQVAQPVSQPMRTRPRPKREA
ncbi:hypothetical protein Tsubulata_013330 [Turnera subulata]|uniref:High chlorophyll fluorescence 153 n=1 Tax=Turnera subulata TaxID=218843 RepID=A0A9Q0G3S1_9ROSI|nr:hypothetical protein Tsubulata_013330 [Turnera subulata]